MTQLAIVDAPTVQIIAKGFFQIGRVGPADSYFDELALVDEKLIVVPSSCDKDFGSNGCLEATSFFGGTYEKLVIEFKFDACFFGVPGEEG